MYCTEVHLSFWKIHAWVFSCFRNPPNSDMDSMIFNVRSTRSFLCVRSLYTRRLDTPTASQHNMFDREQLVFSCAPQGVRTSGHRVLSPTLYQSNWASPVLRLAVWKFILRFPSCQVTVSNVYVIRMLTSNLHNTNNPCVHEGPSVFGTQCRTILLTILSMFVHMLILFSF